MRRLADAERIDKLLRALGREAREETRLYRVGGATMVLSDFVPVPDGWEERVRYVRRDGRLTTYQFGLYAQALAKVERGHAQDGEDVQALLDVGLIDREEAMRAFERIEPELYRYPAIDPATFRRAAETAFGKDPDT